MPSYFVLSCMPVTHVRMLIGSNFRLGLLLNNLRIQLLIEFNSMLSIYDLNFYLITFINRSNNVLCMPSYFDFVL